MTEIQVGDRFDRLTIVGDLGRKGRSHSLLARCDCGSEKEVCARSVKRGRTRSCGCLQREVASRHGVSAHPEYTRLRGMMDRCYRPDSPSYENYGGRGIIVCQEWREDPSAFVRWAEANGGGHSVQIDRIDGDGPYSPENCRFVSVLENQRHRRRGRTVRFAGRDLPLASAAELAGLPYQTVIQRITKLGWSDERALSEPTQRRASHAA